MTIIYSVRKRLRNEFLSDINIRLGEIIATVVKNNLFVENTEALNQKFSLHVSHLALYGDVRRDWPPYPHKHTYSAPGDIIASAG